MHIAPVRRDAPYALHLVHRTGPRRFLHPEALLALLTTRLGDRVNVSLLFTNCSLACQVHVFGDADILLTVHGAAETNILFMRPRTVLIEAFPPYFVEGTYMNMAGFLRVQYLSVTTYNVRTSRGDCGRRTARACMRRASRSRRGASSCGTWSTPTTRPS